MSEKNKIKGHKALDSLVDGLISLEKKSKAFASDVNNRGLSSVLRGESYKVSEPFKVPHFEKSFDDIIEIGLYFPNYEVSYDSENVFNENKLMNLKATNSGLKDYHVKIQEALTFLECILEPQQDMSEKEYLKLFKNAYYAITNVFEEYTNLVSDGVIKPKDDDKPGFYVKIDLQKLIGGVDKFKDAFANIEGKIDNLEGKNSRRLGLFGFALKRKYKTIKDYADKVLEIYSNLLENGYVEEWNKGINLLDKSNKKYLKPSAKLMYQSKSKKWID
ncbi:MAG: hypothetical protein PWP03_800 [Candidatus Woesearchaeota archaeon]|nr:hypothetical protein [Candidatus Woesearchaeota archaeon]MDN5328162.1 hypothetical protein [Candidatus Woesearchaeota archaeon]